MDGGDLLVAVGDTASFEVVRGQLNLDTVSGQDADVVHAHLSRDVSEHLVAIFELDSEHGVGERLDDCSFQNNRVFLGLCQCGPPDRTSKDPGAAQQGAHS